MLDSGFWNNALANAVGTIIASAIIGIVIYIFRKALGPLRRWLYQQNSRIALFLQSLLALIWYPYLRLIVFLIALTLVYTQSSYKNLSLIISIILFFSFFTKKNKFYRLSSHSSIFSDDFKDSKNKIDGSKWQIKTGQPSVYLELGRPRLQMSMANPIEATNSFLIAQGIEIDKGTVECEIYLSPGSVFNIVFLADMHNHNWHMARFDSRTTEADSFLIKDQGKGVNWRFNKRLGVNTSANQWHSIRIEFNKEKAKMFRDGDFLGEITDPQIFGKKIGLFNECGEVLIADFSIANT